MIHNVRHVTRSGRKKNAAIASVLEESEKNLLAAFEKSSRTLHRGIKGDGRSKLCWTFSKAGYQRHTDLRIFRNPGDGRFEELIEEAGPGIVAVHSSPYLSTRNANVSRPAGVRMDSTGQRKRTCCSFRKISQLR